MKKFLLYFSVVGLLLSSCSKVDLKSDGSNGESGVAPKNIPTGTTSVTGNGDVVTVNRTVGDFDSIDYTGIGSLIFVQGNETYTRVEAESNIEPLIKTELINRTLKITFKSNTSISTTKPIKIYSGSPSINSLTLNGTNSLFSNTINTPSLTTNITAGSKLDLSGSATKLFSTLAGTSNQQTVDLVADEVTVNATGTSKGYVNASKKLNVNLDGVVKLYYKGKPVITSSISFTSNLIKL
ncbi:hypothetical protein EZJ43_07640 [Pedobacter changchengzhani]|uniref:Putative auto-transporter adhesin head GIN domain-containing protein n=1 Tax=Pedobacter changchengzhani TaxID=2529274 RepID=A0A4R5MLA8_9SPHI|nr:DUF2807 domain-containing protein [Pedobacter changchengzhani]TDG36382.1 hypothetical protein EZJ43_07640 [Pedobacter changchengzhani]